MVFQRKCNWDVLTFKLAVRLCNIAQLETCSILYRKLVTTLRISGCFLYVSKHTIIELLVNYPNSS